jgi:pyruvate,water dikinase
MSMRVVGLDRPEAVVHAVTGGKGANLGQLVGAGFRVPPGFVVTTEAYRAFLAEAGLVEEISGLADTVDYDDLLGLEHRTADIRTLFEKASFPAALGAEIAAAYADLEPGALVAVRSSGTAEDLAGASFAGLHDTYLDVLGADGVLDAVKRCWVSLWTARATTYRHRNGFDHGDAALAVVVQRMVPSAVSGVMFTGNPLTAATDEIVINASWGLGEAVVQGIVAPDQYTVAAKDLTVIEQVVGTKALRIVRDPDSGCGVVEQEVPAGEQNIPCLTADQIADLGRLGRRVQAHYEDMPQDIEWAFGSGDTAGVLYLLQSRPITGVDFSWDADCSAFQAEVEDPHSIWTRVPMDDIWTGAITPLMFSWRGESWAYDSRSGSVPILGCHEISKIRAMRYYRGEAYQNVEVDRAWTKKALPIARPGLAQKIPADMRDEAINAPFSYLAYAKQYLRAKVLYPEVGNPYGWMKSMQHYNDHRVEEAHGLPDEQLPLLTDEELRRYALKQIAFESEYNYNICWPGLFLWSRDIFTLLGLIVAKWYDGDNTHAFTELIAGSQKITKTVQEHLKLHEMGQLVLGSERLSRAFENLRDGAFFDSLQESEDGRKLDELVTAFLAFSGHRGHADRDIYFPRYADDAGVLYRALQAQVKSNVDPMILQNANNERRERVIAEVEANIRRKPMGALKAEAFKWCLTYVLRFQEWRDDERHFIDRNTYSIRKAFLEFDRRARERGLFETDRDIWFVTKEELFKLITGRANMTLIKAKIEGRRRNFDGFDRKDYMPPKFLYRNRELPEAATADETVDGQRVLRGTPTSRGTVTGTARVVKQLSQIDRVNNGEILIVNSTDPGWTPVFALINGVIAETGGLLSHFSCLAREYGFPAAQVENALRLIPDGATITLNGDTGEVRVHAEELEEARS